MSRPTAEERMQAHVFANVTEGGSEHVVYADEAVLVAEIHAAAEVEAATAELRRERDEARAALVELAAGVAGERAEPTLAEGYARPLAEVAAYTRDRAKGWQQRAEKAEAEVERLGRSRDEAYTERNALVAALSKVFPASLEQHSEADASWDPEWRTIVAVDLPTGQATWHIHDREREMFAHLRPRVGYAWDGHTTAEKYARIAALAPAPQESDPA